jgi:hypothetical protein
MKTAIFNKHEIDKDGQLRTKSYDERDDFNCELSIHM